MKEREIDPKEGEDVREAVRAFYDLHPYPPPVDNLEDYPRCWQDAHRRRADFHLHWPRQPYREDLRVLVAGCRTSTATIGWNSRRCGCPKPTVYANDCRSAHQQGLSTAATTIQAWYC